MRPLLSDKGKKVQPSTPGLADSYKQTVLANLHFKSLDKIDDIKVERMQFGLQNLIAYGPSNLTFRHLPNCQLDKQQTCLIDNIWIAHNKKDTKYIIAVLNALGYYFTNKNKDNKFKYYVVVHGKTNGVFQTWIEVLDSIKDFHKPLFKGFNDFTEALDYARGILGPNYYISPALRQNPEKIPQYNIQKDTDKIIFCDHCSSMTEAFKRLNLKNEALIEENAKLREKLSKLESKGKNIQTQTDTQGFPSQTKMDEMGVHSPLNARKSTVSDNDTASPVQTVAGKDFSNPLMAVTLPKSEKDESSSSRRKLPLSFNQTIRRKVKKAQKNKELEFLITQTVEKLLKQKQEKDKHINPSPIQSPRQISIPSPNNSDNFEDSIQFAQDPNDDDSGASFDSIALHNLDT